ncbi:HpcH/HpaI aldolase/citrate lyase family protein [Steroidobacter flavus]|uniref:HpcH/HpaI aldolase/citrate lyase family protein n=1 Tax=Steroidobacter flavus TaxID=1842136 RepID=A0ABV8SXV5_9GAMM
MISTPQGRARARHDTGFWFSTPNGVAAELAAARGFGYAVLDLEHGAFDQSALDLFIPLCRALGLRVMAKVLGPQAEAIQQALDFGADGVIVPHVLDIDHARAVCAHASYPPRGDRSYAAGRIVGYGKPPTGFFAAENERVICLPMIESAQALRDVELILALETVDGVFVGPTDLALSRGRSEYVFNGEDQRDIERIAVAARAAGKPWVLPAWSPAERSFAAAHGASWTVVVDERGALVAGLDGFLDRLQQERAA